MKCLIFFLNKFTLKGIFIVSNSSHPSKAILSIKFTEEGIFICYNEKHLFKKTCFN